MSLRLFDANAVVAGKASNFFGEWVQGTTVIDGFTVRKKLPDQT
jgi:hypothetical protein